MRKATTDPFWTMLIQTLAVVGLLRSLGSMSRRRTRCLVVHGSAATLPLPGWARNQLTRSPTLPAMVQ